MDPCGIPVFCRYSRRPSCHTFCATCARSCARHSARVVLLLRTCGQLSSIGTVAYEVDEHSVAHRLGDGAGVLTPLAERRVGNSSARLEQPPRRALRRSARGWEHQRVGQEGVVAFLLSVIFPDELYNYLLEQIANDLDEFVLVDGVEGCRNIHLDEVQLRPVVSYAPANPFSSHSPVVLEQLALQRLHRREDLVSAEEARTELVSVSVLLQRQDLVQPAQGFVRALRARGTGRFLFISGEHTVTYDAPAKVDDRPEACRFRDQAHGTGTIRAPQGDADVFLAQLLEERSRQRAQVRPRVRQPRRMAEVHRLIPSRRCLCGVEARLLSADIHWSRSLLSTRER